MTPLILACLTLSLSAVIVGGVLLGFSDFIMRALLQSPPASAIGVMQKINVTVMRSIFLKLFLALAPASLALSAFVWQGAPSEANIWIYSGTALYVTGSFLVTIFGNVPMNNRLAGLAADTQDAAIYWQIYGRRWTQLNSVRTLACIASAVCFLGAALVLL